MADEFTESPYENPSSNPYQVGGGLSNAYAPSPTDERPTSVVIFGILNIVFGILGVFGIIMGIVGFLFMMFVAAPGQEAANPLMPFQGQGPMHTAFMVISMSLGAIFTVVLIFGGIGLLKMRRMGRTLSIAYAWYTIIAGIVGAFVNYFFVMGPIMAQQMPAGAGAPPPQLILAMSIGGMCVGLIYPVLLLIFMNRRNVVAALQ